MIAVLGFFCQWLFKFILWFCFGCSKLVQPRWSLFVCIFRGLCLYRCNPMYKCKLSFGSSTLLMVNWNAPGQWAFIYSKCFSLTVMHHPESSVTNGQSSVTHCSLMSSQFLSLHSKVINQSARHLGDGHFTTIPKLISFAWMFFIVFKQNQQITHPNIADYTRFSH